MTGHHSLLYRLYIGSTVWEVRRYFWLRAAGWRCERCGFKHDPPRHSLTVHHKSYVRLGHERREDVEVLCWPCHRGAHAWRAAA